jgi:ABC-2 type transport system permease protein
MRKLLATINKEFLLLVRDIPGLTLLFVMPVILVIVITLVQEKSVESIKESKVSLLFIDNDNSQLSEAVEKGIISSNYFEVKKSVRGQGLTETEARALVAKGEEQIAVIIPENATRQISENAKIIINSSLTGIPNQAQTAKVTIYLDPNIKESYRNSVTSAIKSLVQGAEIKIMFDIFMNTLPVELNKQVNEAVEAELKKLSITMKNQIRSEIKKRFGKNAPEDFNINKSAYRKSGEKLRIDLKKMKFPWKPESLVKVNEVFPSKKEATIRPTFVQNNVPAFALFAMFFIVIPLAGSMITERNEGAYNRLRTLPVSYFTLLSGKIIIYTLVCLVQLFFMIIIGIYFFPHFLGIPALQMGSEYGAIIFVAIASAFAAIGFGLLMGTYASTHGQAAMFGSVMVVVLAIIGGIFIPVYLMPDLLRKISVFSPIRWGIDSFIDLFVRGGNIKSVLPNSILLFLFFIAASGLSLYKFTKRN